MRRWGEWVLRHRRIVMVVWLLVAVGRHGGDEHGQRPADHRLLPARSAGHRGGAEDHRGIPQRRRHLPLLATLTMPEGQTLTGHEDEVAAAFSSLAGVSVPLRVVDEANTGDRAFRTADDRTAYAMVFYPFPRSAAEPLPTDLVQTTLRSAAPVGDAVAVTGMDALAVGDESGGNGVLAETLLGAVGALAVLLFVFASLLAFLPLLIAAVSILTTFLLLLPLTYLTDVSFIVQFLVALVGLGVAIDYSLLFVTRWREERDHGRDNHEAVVAAMETAGHAVLFSGITVAIGLLALVVLPVPFLRSIGLGGALIPLASVLVTLTLTPAILGGIGPRVDWPKIRHETQPEPRLDGLGRSRGPASLDRRLRRARRPRRVLRLVPRHQDRRRRLLVAGHQRPGLRRAPGARGGRGHHGRADPHRGPHRDRQGPVGRRHARPVDGIDHALVPTGAGPRVDGKTVVVLVPDEETGQLQERRRGPPGRDAADDTDGVLGVAGLGHAQVDFLHAVYGNFPLMLGLISLFTYILLVRAFRSLLLPLKAVLLNLVSLIAVFGLMVLFWQEGFGSDAVFGIAETGAVTFWIPIMVFAFLYGLSMDYEVFILSRVREEYDAGASTDAAVIQGIGRTGRLVTSAALILFLAFAALASGPGTDIKVLATGLGFGILLDATMVRALLVPALVSLFGSWNWQLPDAVAKVLWVPPSTPHPEESRPGGRLTDGCGSGDARPERAAVLLRAHAARAGEVVAQGRGVAEARRQTRSTPPSGRSARAAPRRAAPAAGSPTSAGWHRSRRGTGARTCAATSATCGPGCRRRGPRRGGR